MYGWVMLSSTLTEATVPVAPETLALERIPADWLSGMAMLPAPFALTVAPPLGGGCVPRDISMSMRRLFSSRCGVLLLVRRRGFQRKSGCALWLLPYHSP